MASLFCYTVAASMNEPECANPQLLQFLKEWWDVAKERSSKGATVYGPSSSLSSHLIHPWQDDNHLSVKDLIFAESDAQLVTKKRTNL